MDWQDAMEDWSAYLREHDTEGEQALAAMDDEARREAFTLELTFGTGGLRGVLGMGPRPHEPVYGWKGLRRPWPRWRWRTSRPPRWPLRTTPGI